MLNKITHVQFFKETTGKQMSLLKPRHVKAVEEVIDYINMKAINTGKLVKMSGGNFYRMLPDDIKSYGCVSGCTVYKAYDRYNKTMYIIAQPLEEDWGMYEQGYRYMTITYRLED